MSSSATAGGVVIISHGHLVPQAAQQQVCVGMQKFSKGKPLVLGTVQIMVGLMVLLFGIAMTINADTFGVYSGIFVWGALIYITAGSLTVAAGKYLNRCLVNGALGVSVVAAVAACTGTILYSLDAAGLLMYCYDYGMCIQYMTRMQFFSGILAVFSLLQLIVSVVVSGFACSATCYCNTEVVTYIQNPEEQRTEPPGYSTVHMPQEFVRADQPAPKP